MAEYIRTRSPIFVLDNSRWFSIKSGAFAYFFRHLLMPFVVLGKTIRRLALFENTAYCLQILGFRERPSIKDLPIRKMGGFFWRYSRSQHSLLARRFLPCSRLLGAHNRNGGTLISSGSNLRRLVSLISGEFVTDILVLLFGNAGGAGGSSVRIPLEKDCVFFLLRGELVAWSRRQRTVKQRARARLREVFWLTRTWFFGFRVRQRDFTGVILPALLLR